MNKILVIILVFFLASCMETKELEISSGAKISDNSIVYALPQTNLVITIEATKTITKKGIYAEFADKYLHIKNVPTGDSQKWTITNTKIDTQMDADPLSYYTVTYKTYPDNLDKLFSISEKGIILDFANSWKSIIKKNLNNEKSDSIFDPELVKPVSEEKIDTFYKNIITDSTFRRIPIIKKQILAKTIEDEANETANLILKIRKSRIKLIRGKLDYPPDGEALKVNLEELNKLENMYLSMFCGMKFQEKRTYTYYVTPKKDQLTADLCYFSADKGIQTQPLPGNRLLTLQLNKLSEVNSPNVIPGKKLNILYFRVPLTVNAVLKLSNDILVSKILQVYQFGFIQELPIKN